MRKFLYPVLCLAFAGLISCYPPIVVRPPNFDPNPPFPPRQVEPYGAGMDVSPPPDSYNPDPPVIREKPPAPSATGGYPTAQKTANPNEVISPYEPFNVIDVAGYESGRLVRDPSNQKIFRVP